MTSARYFRRPDLQTFTYLKNARRAGFVQQVKSSPALLAPDKRNRRVESTCTISAAGSTGRCNTIQCIESAMFAGENQRFGCARLKTSQASVPAGLTLTSDLGICLRCQRVLA